MLSIRGIEINTTGMFPGKKNSAENCILRTEDKYKTTLIRKGQIFQQNSDKVHFLGGVATFFPTSQ